MAKVLVTGAAGLLGRALCAAAAQAGWEVEGTVHVGAAPASVPVRRLDVRDPDAVRRVVADARADAVVHCAYVQADDAVTRDGALHVAAAARAAGARLVHLSSDVVFSGRLGRPYREDDPTDPVSAYGAAKAAVEEALARLDPAALVVRTSLLYAPDGPPDPQTRLALDPTARLFTDERRRPVAVGDLAAALVRVLAREELHGVLHLVGADVLDRLAFARLLAAHRGRDPAELEGGDGPPGRPKVLDLDTARAEALGLRLRGAREVLAP